MNMYGAYSFHDETHSTSGADHSKELEKIIKRLEILEHRVGITTVEYKKQNGEWTVDKNIEGVWYPCKNNDSNEEEVYNCEQDATARACGLNCMAELKALISKEKHGNWTFFIHADNSKIKWDSVSKSRTLGVDSELKCEEIYQKLGHDKIYNALFWGQ